MVYFWIRRQVRKVIPPIPQKKAEAYTAKFTALYVLSAWTACGIMIYTFVQERRTRKENDPSYDFKHSNSGYMYGRMFHAENMQIYQVSNGELIKEGSYKASEDDYDKKTDEEFYGDKK